MKKLRLWLAKVLAGKDYELVGVSGMARTSPARPLE